LFENVLRTVLSRGLFPLVLLFAACAARAQDSPRNIIFMIGDGMGFGHLSALLLDKPQARMAGLPVTGFSLTSSLTSLVTESGAGGTALSTGRRTANRRIGMDSAANPLQNLLEHARSFGKAPGVVATSSITHATPAAFLSHETTRRREFEIAGQSAGSSVETLIAGGLKYFRPAGKGGARNDGRDLLAEMEASGYSVRDSIDCPSDADRFIILGAEEELPPAGRRSYSLADLVRCSLSRLSRREAGFVLMVEGSQIDWAAHSNDFQQLLLELRDFDEAVGVALDFATTDENTLVVVTADHETGGLSVIGDRPDGSDMRGIWASTDHTADLVPLMAFGPGCRHFSGMHRNEEIGSLLFSLVGAQQ